MTEPAFGPLEIAPGVSLAATVAPPWAHLQTLSFVVLVGVTGVGKSTTLASLGDLGVSFFVLPDRRVIADKVMIEPFVAPGTPLDREARFALTAQYRQTHPGGMAEAMQQLALLPRPAGQHIVFDGLRGLNEVQHAATHCPGARFVVLDAPDAVRVRRLLGRNDAFDGVAATSSNTSSPLLEQLRGIAGIAAVFDAPQLAQLAALPLPAQDVVAKSKIVVSERRHYDPVAAREYLLNTHPKRVLYLDTTQDNAHAVAQKIGAWL